MHYCNWNIADYAAHTAHLSMVEDIAYRRMLDLYYLHEKPLPKDPKQVARDIRMREHEQEVRSVLAEFFVRSPCGYTNKRADAEIAKYRAKVEAAANAGRTSAQRRSNAGSTTVERPLNDRPTDVQRPCNEKPTDVQPTNPKNQEPVPPLPLHSEGRVGADASPDPAPETTDPAIQLQRALMRSPYRSALNTVKRAGELIRRADEMVKTGLTPGDVERLAAIDAQKAETPGALLAHWLDENLWREVLDEADGKAKERDLRERRRAAEDPLAGVYGA